MKRRLRWSRRATRDLMEIGDHVAADDASAARRWIEGRSHVMRRPTTTSFRTRARLGVVDATLGEHRSAW